MKTIRTLTIALATIITGFSAIVTVDFMETQKLPQTEKVKNHFFLSNEKKDAFLDLVSKVADEYKVAATEVQFNTEKMYEVKDGKFTGDTTEVYTVKIGNDTLILFSDADAGTFGNDLFDETIHNFTKKGPQLESIAGIKVETLMDVVHGVNIF